MVLLFKASTGITCMFESERKKKGGVDKQASHCKTGDSGDPKKDKKGGSCCKKNADCSNGLPSKKNDCERTGGGR